MTVSAPLVAVVAVDLRGDDAIELTFKTPEGWLDNEVVYRTDEARLEIAN